MSKLIEVYIENEKVDQFYAHEESFPPRLLEFYLSKNPTVIDITNFNKMPAYNMIWNGNNFIFSEEDIEMSENSLQDIEYIKNKNGYSINKWIEDSGIQKQFPEKLKVLALLDGNIFKESFTLEEEVNEKQIAIFMSNPRYEITELNE
jgi:hypothetical protein